MYIFVLHNGRKGGEITDDCRVRIEAASRIAAENPNAAVCFVGGGGLRPMPGAQSMCKFWRKKYHQLNNSLVILENSNNTAANIKEIAEFLSEVQQSTETILISNGYHVGRIKYFVRRNKLDMKALGAEDVLHMKKCRSSFAYVAKQIAEQILILYAKIDREQLIIKLWRKYYG